MEERTASLTCVGNQPRSQSLYVRNLVKSLKNHTDGGARRVWILFQRLCDSKWKSNRPFVNLISVKFGLCPISPRRNTTRIVSISDKKVQKLTHLKRLNSRKITQCIFQVVSSTLRITSPSSKSKGAGSCVGFCLWQSRVSWTNTPIGPLL